MEDHHFSFADLDHIEDMINKTRADIEGLAELVTKNLGLPTKKVHRASSPVMEPNYKKRELTAKDVEALPQNTTTFSQDSTVTSDWESITTALGKFPLQAI